MELLPSGNGVASIPVELQIEALISLRILSREQYGIDEITTSASIKKLLKFTGLSGDVKVTLSQIMDNNSGLALQGEIKQSSTHGHLLWYNYTYTHACTHKALYMYIHT